MITTDLHASQGMTEYAILVLPALVRRFWRDSDLGWGISLKQAQTRTRLGDCPAASTGAQVGGFNRLNLPTQH